MNIWLIQLQLAQPDVKPQKYLYHIPPYAVYYSCIYIFCYTVYNNNYYHSLNLLSRRLARLKISRFLTSLRT